MCQPFSTISVRMLLSTGVLLISGCGILQDKRIITD
ncbi:hypothetical protein Golax_019053 [Gossypium laxum]|uniref:Uncharacterized protein n=2 Tax=Gossypium TaxID=3633 RepID=A0A7J8LGS4_9ROSI|nr:hypothetical protein [Gossypium lobatum]MBA0706971.1 hypothetical protein [Gossypium laxum]